MHNAKNKFDNRFLEKESISMISAEIPNSLRKEFAFKVVEREVTKKEAIIEALNAWITKQT